MAKYVIQSKRAEPPQGAYSQGWRAGDFIFVPGTGPLDPATGCLTTTHESGSQMRCLPVRVTKESNFISIRVWQGRRPTLSTERAIQPQIRPC
jgi:hypothetical protein